MDILVTGGAGFIGGNLAEHFVRRGHDVTTLDNLDPYYTTDLKEHNVEMCRVAASATDGAFELVEGSILNDALVESTVANADVVYHQAAQAGVRTSIDNPNKAHEVNVDGTLNILNAARDADVERVVVASSSSVYGETEYLPFDELHPTRPTSPYGVSKLAAEQYARVYGRVYDVDTVALRYFTVYGPRMRPNMAISNFVSRCLNGDQPVIYGDGQQTRDFTYIDDIVRVNEKLLESDLTGEVLNVGSNDNITIQRLAETIRDQLAPELDIEYTNANAGDARHTHADVSKATELLDYEPEVSIEDGVSRFIDWYREERDWYEPLIYE
jgi:UDP-glucose 4-epimerase